MNHIRQEAIMKAAKKEEAVPDEESRINGINNNNIQEEPTMTEGVIYLIPPNLVDECLQELDFREKGGYARDIIDVIEDVSGELHQALLYRGTPDNPAFWSRALLDLDYAAGKKLVYAK